ncbi:MAG: RtcB family protein, partial [Acidobacteriota bacterium]|nr:RtcB family protein [Acidobacteriota bacterium]
MSTIPAAERIDPYRWRIPRKGPMRVDGIVYASHRLMEDLREDPTLQQVANVACLPGIQVASLAMPDAHWGYGFPIGGVAAFDLDEGVVSPGGVGYDINCGVRMLKSHLERGDLTGRMKDLVDEMFKVIPTGVGAHRKDEVVERREMEGLLRKGAAFMVERGFGYASDLDAIEAGGVLDGADPKAVSPRALERGRAQVGTVGSG